MPTNKPTTRTAGGNARQSIQNRQQSASGAKPPDFKALFMPGDKVKQRLRVLYWGDYGTGKTRAALTFPRPAIIATDPGVLPYMGRLGKDAFYFEARTLESVLEAIEAVRADNGQTIDTLILDSISPILSDLRARYLSNSQTGYLGESDHVRLNIKIKDLYNALAALPVHVVVTARSRNVYERNAGGGLKLVGLGIDADNQAGYAFGFVVRKTKGDGGVVENSKGYPLDGALSDVTWEGIFKLIAQTLSDGVDPQDLSNRTAAQLFVAYWNQQGFKSQEIVKALGVEKISHFQGTRADADSILEAARNQRAGATRWKFETIHSEVEAAGWGFGKDMLIGHPQHLTNLILKLTRAKTITPDSTDEQVLSAIAAHYEIGGGGEHTTEPEPEPPSGSHFGMS